ncbi:hypothetical protein lerEdw1_003016 [Lerista edwardsae]|nr:hypothetical protein lerEdw1_003016 [Lerista edwardsae]
MESWQQWSYLTGGAGTGRIRNWDRGHPLDLNDEFIREDPNYDEARVNQEALQDYLAERGLWDAAAASGKPASRNCDAPATLESDGGAAELQKPSMPTGGRPRSSSRERLAMQKKPRVVLSRMSAPRPPQGADDKSRSSSSSDSSSEEKEAARPPSMRRSSGGVTRSGRDKAKKRQAFSADESSHLGFSKQKVIQSAPEARGAPSTTRSYYMCNVCDKRSLKHHMRLHFAFSCTQCANSFLCSEQLRWHMLSPPQRHRYMRRRECASLCLPWRKCMETRAVSFRSFENPLDGFQ